MSSSSRWLYEQLWVIAGVTVEMGATPLIIANHNGSSYRIYTQTSDDYIVSVHVVDRVKGLGGKVISYALWIRVLSEAKMYAIRNGVEILPHAALFTRFGK